MEGINRIMKKLVEDLPQGEFTSRRVELSLVEINELVRKEIIDGFNRGKVTAFPGFEISDDEYYNSIKDTIR